MTRKPYKFVVQSVVQVVEDEEVTGEETLEAVTVFGVKALAEWAEAFAQRLDEIE